MRLVFGVLALLLVAAVVMFSSKQQLEAVAPSPGPAGGTAVAPSGQADQTRRAVEDALQQGAARASEAMP